MTATISTTVASTDQVSRAEVSDGERSTSKPSLVRAGAVAGVVAAVATTVIAAVAHAAGVSLETAPGEQIPVLGFGQLTLFFTAVGIVLATVLRRRARNPRSTFVKTTLVLTALSIVPDLLLSADTATKVTLVASHLVAAAIVIPALAAHLPEPAQR
jgi:hypothetical protein